MKMHRIAGALFALLLACPLVGSATPDVRDLSTLKNGELAKLSSTAQIRLPHSRRIVTVADLIKAHDLRMARFANAKASAIALMARMHYSTRVPIGIAKRPIPALGSPTPSALNAAALQNHITAYINATKPQLLPVATSAGSYTFALDYVQTCNEFKASACIYFPADMAANNPGQEIWSDGTDQGFFDSDYLVDQEQCTAGSGNWDGDAPNKRCDYYYPAQSFARWTETAPPSVTISGTCLDGSGQPNPPFQEQLDQHGVLMLTFNGGVSPANSCFVQVIAVPA